MNDQIDGVLGGLGLGSAPVNTQPKTDTIDSVLGGLNLKPPAQPEMAPLQSAQAPVQEQGRLIGRDVIVPRDSKGLPIPSAGDDLTRLERERSALPSRDVGQFVGDNINDAATGFVGLVGSVVSTGIALTGKGAEYLGDEGGILDSFGKAAGDYAVDYAETANDVTDFMRSGKSDLGTQRDASHAASSMIESQQNLAAYEQAIADGEDPFIASLMWIGNEGITAGSRVLNDPSQTVATVASALGSLAVSGKIAGAASRLATGLAAKAGVTEGRTLAAAEVIGSALGTGVVEGTGTYTQTVGEVMDRTHSQMLTSPLYRDLLDQGVDPLEAQKEVANVTGMNAFEINLPMAIAAGVISSKFNANPAGAFTGKNIIAGMAEVGEQTLEEAAQGGASQIATNMAIQANVDDSQYLAEGIGEQIAVGAIGGAGMAGAIGAPAMIKGTVDEIDAKAQASRDEARFVRGMGDQIAAQRQRDAVTRDPEGALKSVFTTPETATETMVKTAGQGLDAAKDVVSGVLDFVRNGREAIQPVVDAATSAVSTVKKAATDYMEKSDPVVQGATVEAASEAVILAQTRLSQATPDAPASESLVTFTAASTDAPASVPKDFGEAVSPSGSLADTMSGVVTALKTGTVKVASMSDEAVMFVAENYNKVQGLIPGLPEDVRTSVQKLLASPDLKRIRQRASRVDLNAVAANVTGKITDTVKNLTISVAKLNPMNVNPTIVGKILEQDDRNDLTPQKIKTLKVAQKAAIAMNEHIADSVQIEEDKYFKLTAAGNKIAKPETASENASRDLIVGDLSGDNKVPSVNEYLRQIVQGVDDPAGMTTSEKGVAIPVAGAISRFRMLVQHMQNKVGALNESFDGSGENGKGPTVNFTSLVGGKELRQKGLAGSATVYYHKSSENSVALARRIGADAQVVVKVWNALAEAYPNQFPEGPLKLPTVKAESKPEAAAAGKPEGKTIPAKAEPKTMNIWFGSGENSWLSNLADRPFTFRSERFFSVEHAYQTWKSGVFDQKTFSKYTKAGVKIQGKATKTEGGWNLRLMKALMVASFQQNPVAAGRLVATGDTVFTHSQDKGIWKDEFPRILTEVRAALVAEGVKPTTVVEGTPPGVPEPEGDAEINNLKEKITARYTGRLPAGWTIVFDDSDTGSLAGTSPSKKTVRINVKKILADFKAGLTYLDGLEGQTSAQKAEVFKDIDLAAFKAFIQGKNVSTYIGFIMAHEQAHIAQLERGAVYNPNDLLDPINIALEREANAAGFAQIGFNPTTAPEGDASASPEVVSDKDGKPVRFFHGTRGVFKQFVGKEIFFTTDSFLAKVHATRTGGSTDAPRVIEANLAFKNPLKIPVKGDEDLDVYWLKNALNLRTLMENGNHDGVVLSNDAGIYLAVATDNSQINQIKTGSPFRFQSQSKVFQRTFKPRLKAVKFTDADTMLDTMDEEGGSDTYTQFAREQIEKVKDAMNERVATLKILAKKTETPAEALKTRADEILEFREMKALAIVDPVTGKYDETLLGLAVLAVVDWMTTARPMGSRNLDDALEELGLDIADLTEDEVKELMDSVPTRTTSEKLARKVIKLWNVEVVSEAQMVDYRGITEGIIKEIFTVMSQQENSWIDLVKVQTKDGLSAGYGISSLKTLQDQIGVNAHGLMDKTFFPEDQVMASFGVPPKGVAKTVNDSDVTLPPMVRSAMKKVQETAHLRAEPVIEFFGALGQDAFATMSGRRSPGALPAFHPYRATIEGKNRGIDRDWETAFTMADGARAKDGTTVGVFYRVGITVVGRMQMIGINPQNNKLLRAMVTPTHAKLDMANNQTHKNGFWLTVAQSSGIAKVEKKNHADILKTVREDFMKVWGKSVSVALDYLESGSLDQDAFVFEMVTATGGEAVSVAQMNAVLAVARLIKAKRDSTLETFETSLSFELDGKTDGPANMMVALGQGIMTRKEYENFFRVGYFLGQPTGTLNKWFSEGGTDLYEEGSANSMRKMVQKVSKAKPYYAKRIMALQRFAAHFGDFKIVDGEVVMTRATSKNPMTKKVYGSGPTGIGRGIAAEIVQGMYAQLMDMPAGSNFTQYLNYPEFLDDFKLVFDQDLGAKADPRQVIIKGEVKLEFDSFVTNVIGRLLSESTEEIISVKTKGVTDLLVQATNVQGQFMQKLFIQLLDKRAAELVKEGRMRVSSNGEPNLRQFPKGDYEAIIKQVMEFAPYYADGLQNIRVGDFEGELSGIEMSSNLTGNIRSKSTMEIFGEMGVKAIPYLIQARGDAMMINRIFSAEDGPQRAIPIFDGIDLSVTDFADASVQINRSVLENWNHDVMGPVVSDFTGFSDKVENGGFGELLNEVYAEMAANENMTPSGADVNSENLIKELQEVALLNQARKNVFKRISKSVDHMGGAARPYTVGTETFTYEEINQMIQEEETALMNNAINGTFTDVTPPPLALPAPDSTPVSVESTLVVTDSGTVFDALAASTGKSAIRQTMKALKDIIPKDTRVVMGSPDEVYQWIKENLPNFDGANGLEHRAKKAKGFYHIDSNTVFVVSDNPETITHELIHMATFQAVLDHYAGDQSNEAVKNLEILMDQFLDMDFAQASKTLSDAALSAMAQILKHKAKDDPFSKAAALNEFMAWTLSNAALIKELKATPSALIMNMTKRALAWIQRILGLGTVPTDMYSNILFNTAMVGQGPDPKELGNGGTGNIPPNTSGGNVTPQASGFTNFWIDLLRQRLDESKTYQPYRTQGRLLRYIDTADRVVSSLAQGGIVMNAYQSETFTAIHAVVAAELTLDSKGLLALGKMYDYITNSLTSEMFGTGPDAQLKYSTVMNALGETKNDEGVSDAIAVLLGLSQTSTAFRNALDKIPRPESSPGVNTSSLNDILSTSTAMLMQKMIYSTDTEGKGVKEILDTLSDRIIQNDKESEFQALKYLMSSFDAADKFTNGMMSQLAQKAKSMNEKLQASNASGVTKVILGSVALATQFIDTDTSKIVTTGIKQATHMDGILDGAVFIREFIAEVIGGDGINNETIQLLDRVNYEVQAARQGFREELPVILQNEFETSPDSFQWKALHWILGKADFGILFSMKDPDQAFEYLNDENVLDAEIAALTRKLNGAFGSVLAQEILTKGQQLADYMNSKGAGFQLWRNAYAIHELSGAKKPDLIPLIDRLVSLMALKGADPSMKESVARMQASDPKGVHSLLVYIQGLNKEEDSKTIQPVAKMNGYKGYMPNIGSEGRSLIIASDDEIEKLQSRGYTRVKDYTGYDIAPTSMGYYISGTRQVGNYSQGVLQQVQDTYRGVNAINGVTVSGGISGLITSPAEVIAINDHQNQVGSVADPKETLMPVFDANGGVMKYELALNPDLMETHLEPESNAGLMVGVWAGRQVEEKLSKAYNDELILQLKKIWDNRKSGTDGLFIRMDRETKDKVYKESWEVIPPNVKDEIRAVFGEEGFMVRKDMINLALGYRDPTIVDVWNGTHRLPEGVSLAIQVAAKATMGKKALTRLSTVENATMATISTAKDLIVVRSLVVPFMNTQSNVFQLANRGVGTKDIARGFSEKFGEIDRLNSNLKKLHGLDIQIKLNQNDKNRVAILEQQRQVVLDENKRMGIYPLVQAGAYKSISEGITELDAQITEGRFGDWVESQMQKLPTGVQTVVKYGLLSKDTAIYKGANKAVQYGDFIAKSIYYDDLLRKGLKPEEAMVKVNEEFVNFSLLPGRQRQFLESMGATWFLTFKIRSMKVALQTIRENPIRSLTAVGVLGLESGPITDNLVGKVADGTISYSMGWDMLWDAPSINPWYTLAGG